MDIAVIDDLRRLALCGTSVGGLVRYAIAKLPRLATDDQELSKTFQAAFALSPAKAFALAACVTSGRHAEATAWFLGDIIRTQAVWNSSPPEAAAWMSQLSEVEDPFNSDADITHLTQFLGKDGLAKLTASEVDGLLLLTRSLRRSKYDLAAVSALAERLQSRIESGTTDPD